jgi:putative membrane protein
MRGYEGGGDGLGPVMWLFLGMFWIALIAVIVFVAVKLLTASADDDGRAGPESPEQILDRLFALGEIDEDTYRSRRAALGEMRPPS